MKGLSATDRRHVDELIKHYVENMDKFSTVIYQLSGYVTSSKVLSALVHSTRQRTKDPSHLRAKLLRKALKAKELGIPFEINAGNLFTKINDLSGFRILHLHTRQAKNIHDELVSIFSEQRWILVEGPVAKTWDNESRDYFRGLGWNTEDSETMYTSIHYVVQPNSRSEVTCEIQVRTLMEEVWGEVDHMINYPVKSTSQSCREQIKVLARLTSSCSRLVDSIFLASAEPKQDGKRGLSKSSASPKRRSRAKRVRTSNKDATV